jgi:DNA-directed RNA polymerase specialized sigma54-like protein
MKPTLQLRISQQLTLTPQLQQAIRLLQLSTQDMHQEVARLLEENPMLEVADESAPGNFSLDAPSSESRSSANRQNKMMIEARMILARIILATSLPTGIPAAERCAARTTKMKPIPSKPPNKPACAHICIVS